MNKRRKTTYFRDLQFQDNDIALYGQHYQYLLHNKVNSRFY